MQIRAARIAWSVIGAIVATTLVACTAVSDAATSEEGEERSASRRKDVPDRETSEPATDEGTPLGPAFEHAALDAFFAPRMKRMHAPGMSAAVVKGGRMAWADGFGLANIAEKRPATKDTVFMLASVSKVVVAAAAMKLVERGTLRLDDDVSRVLGFTLRSPDHPSVPITLRMLLTHTSSLADSDASWGSIVQGDSPISLRSWVTSLVGSNDSWSFARPGSAFAYSNTGYSVAGLVVETAAGKNLQEACREAIFEPLGMSETSWFLRGLDRAHIAMPYAFANGALVPKGLYGYPAYPSGQLRSSAAQMGRFLTMLVDGGAVGEARVLTTGSVAEMRRRQVPSVRPQQLLGWYEDDWLGRTFVGHNGADEGVSTEMYFDPVSRAGYVVLTNSSQNLAPDENPDGQRAFEEISTKLYELGRTLK